MKADRKLFAGLLAGCLLLGLFTWGSAEALTGQAYQSIALTQYSRTLAVTASLFPAQNGEGKFGLINKRGETVLDFLYDGVYYTHEHI